VILTCANTKGGSSKSVSAAYFAHALAEQGHSVIVLDADPQASITRWAEQAEWSIPVRGAAHSRLHVPQVGVDVEARGFDVVVIDTPGTEHGRSVVESAIRASTHVCVPCAPTSSEVDLMPLVRERIADLSHLGRHAAPPVAAALLTRTVAGASSTGVYRELLREDGWHVLTPVVPRLERYAQAHGGPIVNATDTHYGDALAELVKL
jgi:chromosome partitioning protein